MTQSCLFLLCCLGAGEVQEAVDYGRHVKPVLTKYCVGCHEGDEAEGKLSLASFTDLLKGGQNGVAVVPGDGAASRLIQVLTAAAEPSMPPEDNEAPTAAEIALLKRWIDQGAKGPNGAEPVPTHLITPKIEPVHKSSEPIASVDYSPIGDVYAAARFRRVDLHDAATGERKLQLPDHPGKVTSVRFSSDGRWLATATGIAGLFGEARLYDAANGKLQRAFRGHKDLLYAAVLSPAGDILATGGYDRAIILWNVKTGERLRTLDGHNGAVYDLAFSPDGAHLASASGDATVKIWQVSTGNRMDTLSQPLQEQYTVAYSPDGNKIVAGGVDNRIRVWQFVSRTKPQINPILYARFGHEQAVVDLKFTPDGSRLISVSEDQTVKVWETESYTEVGLLEKQPTLAVEAAVAPTGDKVLVARLDGALKMYPLAGGGKTADKPLSQATAAVEIAEADHREPTQLVETEPNDAPEQATAITVPAVVQGVLQSHNGESEDVDLYRFSARKGELWILETNAARSNSPLDSKIEVLTARGERIVRLNLQAVRDSYISFRSIDSRSPDVRCANWEEMQPNQYLYFNGEVCKIHRMPRGPDSGFRLYPEEGTRHCYFDTTATTHALLEPCYVVEPIPVGVEPIPNGLPVFPIYFENDDDSDRKLGTDSQLTFTAPADGEYLVRVVDVRGFGGEDYKYTLTVRPPKPDFTVTIGGVNPAVNAGSGKAFSVNVDRTDGFDGEIHVEIQNVPRGFRVTSPIVVQEGQLQAWGAVYADADAVNVAAAEATGAGVTAWAVVNGKRVEKSVNGGLGALRVVNPPDVFVSLTPYGHPTPAAIGRNWTTLAIEKAASQNGATLAIKQDGAVLAGGPNPENDVYTVAAQGTDQPIVAIRLDALGDSSLPAGGPGRAEGNGNFVLTEVHFAVQSMDAPDQTTPVAVAKVGADYSQNGLDAQGIVDGKDQTGWAVAEEKDGKFLVKRAGADPSHVAVFELAEPLQLSETQRLVVILEQKSEHQGHNLGKFQLSATSDPPTHVVEPAVIEIMAGQTIEATLRVDRRGYKGRVGFEARNLPHGVIVDNIGLNGVLITEDKSERTIYLTAYHWVPATERLFVLESNEGGKQATLPVLLKVKRPTAVASQP